jgi:hypothetical protein
LIEASNQLVFSAASLWEVAIKSGLGRADFRADARLLRRGLIDNGYDELAIAGEHAAAIANLPPIPPGSFRSNAGCSIGRRGHSIADRRPDRRPVPRPRTEGLSCVADRSLSLAPPPSPMHASSAID